MAILFLISLILTLSFYNFLIFPYLFRFHFSCRTLYLSGTCTFFFADISGRNFLSSFGHFWAELFSQGGCTCTQCTPPAYVPVFAAGREVYTLTFNLGYLWFLKEMWGDLRDNRIWKLTPLLPQKFLHLGELHCSQIQAEFWIRKTDRTRCFSTCWWANRVG